jgi:alpha-glucosidase
MWPEFKGRDGCRTPMPWKSAAADLGFSSVASSAKSWLPVAATHQALAADAQLQDPASLLHFYRQLLRWRKTRPSLVSGTLEVLDAHPQVLAYVRRHEGETTLCVFNFSDQPVAWTVPAGFSGLKLVDGSGLAAVALQAGAVALPAWGGAFLGGA